MTQAEAIASFPQRLHQWWLEQDKPIARTRMPVVTPEPCDLDHVPMRSGPCFPATGGIWQSHDFAGLSCKRCGSHMTL